MDLAYASRDKVAPAPRRGLEALWAEVVLAAAAFAALCAIVLPIAPQAAEPDDGAYRASIVAITEGHFLTLSTVQALTLARKLDDNPAAPPNQWVEVRTGRWISEKDPGYPFLAAPFQKLGEIRWAPLFYGALACLGLFIGARRWLGRFGGLAAVGLYCSSGAASAFAWRDHMPTFTDASLIAAGSGLLLWAVLATEARPRRRTWAGLAAFAALELATFVRYTDLVILGCAAVTVLVAWRLGAARLPLRTLGCWLGSVAAFGAGVAAFDNFVYGGPLKTGYQPGEVTFSLSAIGPNLRLMPLHLMQAMPMLTLGLLALAWIIARRLHTRARDDRSEGASRTMGQPSPWPPHGSRFGASIPRTPGRPTQPMEASSVVRFYAPALGAIALLGAWLVTRLPSRTWLAGAVTTVTIAALFGLGVWAFHAMYAAIGVPLHG